MGNLQRACLDCGIEAAREDARCVACGGEVRVQCALHRASLVGDYCAACAREAASSWLQSQLHTAADAPLCRFVARSSVNTLTDRDLERFGVPNPEERLEILRGIAELTPGDRRRLGAEPPRACRACGSEAAGEEGTCIKCGGPVQVQCGTHRVFLEGAFCPTCARDAATSWVESCLHPLAGNTPLRRFVARNSLISLTDAELERLGIREPDRRSEILRGIAGLTLAERRRLGAEPPTRLERLGRFLRRLLRGLDQIRESLGLGRRAILGFMLVVALAVPAASIQGLAFIPFRGNAPRQRLAAFALAWALCSAAGVFHFLRKSRAAASRALLASVLVLSVPVAAALVHVHREGLDLWGLGRLATAASTTWLVVAGAHALMGGVWAAGRTGLRASAFLVVGGASFAAAYALGGPRVVDPTGEFSILRSLDTSPPLAPLGAPGLPNRATRLGFGYFVRTHFPGGRYVQVLPDGHRVSFDCTVSSNYRDGIGRVEAHGTVQPDWSDRILQRVVHARFGMFEMMRLEGADPRLPPTRPMFGQGRNPWVCVEAQGSQEASANRLILTGTSACELAYTMCRGSTVPPVGQYPDGNSDPSSDGFEHFAALHFQTKLTETEKVSLACTVVNADFRAPLGRVTARLEKAEPEAGLLGKLAKLSSIGRISRAGVVTAAYRHRNGRWQCDSSRSSVTSAVNGGGWLAKPCAALEEACRR